MPEYTINLYTKDGKFIKSIDFVKLFHSYFSNLRILDIQRIGNRSILLLTTEICSDNKPCHKALSPKLIKVKGVGVEKYDYHYANNTDKLYNQFVAKTNIKYMRYKVNNPKLNMITRRNIIVVDLPYQDFIGEPIGGCSAKELRAQKIYQQLLDVSVVSAIPTSYVNIFTDSNPIYLVFYYFMDRMDYAGKTLEDLLSEGDKKEILHVFKQVAETMKVFYQSGIIVPKDKNILADISYTGLYNDLADTYIQESDTKYHFFGTLYNLFRLAFYEHTNLYKDTELMSKIYRLFLDTFTFTDTKRYPPIAKNNNKKEEKKKQRIERKIIKELDEIKIAYLIGRILDLKFPTAREQKYFLQQKLGGKVSRYEVGDKLALISYWLLDKYYHYNRSLDEMF